MIGPSRRDRRAWRVTIEEMLYEGYGPGGVGLIVEVTTDNKNRSASEIKYFSKEEPCRRGAAFSFKRKGQILLHTNKDVTELAGKVRRAIAKEHEVIRDRQYDKRMLSKAEVSPGSSELAYLPENLVPVTDEEAPARFKACRDEDLEDVKAVHGNYATRLCKTINSSIFLFDRPIGPTQ